MFAQVAFGSALLVLCALIHVAVIAAGVPLLARFGRAARPWHRANRIALLLSTSIALVLLAHTLEIWLWAAIFAWRADLTSFAEAFYFATVTYTTLGYGDVVLGPNARIFASFAAITGLLTFGVSTAFLIALISRVLPKSYGLR